jgi:hypothetical protein
LVRCGADPGRMGSMDSGRLTRSWVDSWIPGLTRWARLPGVWAWTPWIRGSVVLALQVDPADPGDLVDCGVPMNPG